MTGSDGRIGVHPPRAGGVFSMGEQHARQQVGAWPPLTTYTEWARPSDWLTVTPPSDAEQKFVGLKAVTNDGSNYLAITCAGACHVNWGDGNEEDVATGVKAEHLYDYSAISNDTLCSRGYKQVLVTVTPQAGQNLTSINLNVKHSRSGLSAHDTGWLDLAIAGASLATLTMGASSPTVRFAMVERVYLGTNAVSSFSRLFQGFQCLRTIALNTASGTNFSYMFSDCYSLVSVPLFDTSSGTDFSSMFSTCISLVSVPLFDTSGGLNFSNMFLNCYSLVSVPLFDTSGGTTFTRMFSTCYSLVSVPLFDTSSGTNFSYMFNNCYALTSVPLFDTSIGDNFAYMFYSCLRLTSVPLFDTSGGLNFSNMFFACYSLVSVPLFDTSSGTNFSYMFSGCSSLVSIPALVTSAASSAFTSTLNDCFSLASAPFSGTRLALNYTECKLDRAAIVAVFNGLGTASGSQTITVSGCHGYADLTGDDLAIATGKGWTVG